MIQGEGEDRIHYFSKLKRNHTKLKAVNVCFLKHDYVIKVTLENVLKYLWVTGDTIYNLLLSFSPYKHCQKRVDIGKAEGTEKIKRGRKKANVAKCS